MTLKLSTVFEKQNVLTEEIADFDKGLGKLTFQTAVPQMVYEDYEAEGGEIKRRPTNVVDYYEVKLYSEALGEQIEVKMPESTKFDGIEFEDEVKLGNRSAFFWNDKEVTTYNGQTRTNYYDGVKFRADSIEKASKVNHSNQTAAPKPENKSENKAADQK
ncbi:MULTISPECIES: DUF961 family protein [Lactococcus]|uniref:DUF961 family protein n=1 Tax=Lactococcus TaxID=1357 RepID=UPI001BCAC045|nr:MULTISPECIES: DUF961 family protein [Lactococcus]